MRNGSGENADTKEIVECELNPLDLRLFSGDVVQQNGELIYSKLHVQCDDTWYISDRWENVWTQQK